MFLPRPYLSIASLLYGQSVLVFIDLNLTCVHCSGEADQGAEEEREARHGGECGEKGTGCPLNCVKLLYWIYNLFTM